MKYKVACRYVLEDEWSNVTHRLVYKSMGLPTIQWMEDNVGEQYIDWKCFCHKDCRIHIEFKEEDKMVLFLLKCGDHIEQV